MEEAKSGQMIKLRTSDGQEVTAPLKIFSRSSHINSIIDGGDIEEDIPLPEITKETLDKVITYLEHVD